MGRVLLISILIVCISACSNIKKEKNSMNKSTEVNSVSYSPGSFGFDLEILKADHEIVLLRDSAGRAMVAVSPKWQGRVMTSSFSGKEGYSLAWINQALIKSKEVKKQMNPFGGEDRFWLGPEGGQFTIYYKPGDSFKFANWQVPREIDTEPFDLVKATGTSAAFKRDMRFVNYSGSTLKLLVEREIKLLDQKNVSELLGLPVNDFEMVAFESINKITNTGETAWTRKTGALSIWILGMFQPSESTTIIVPFKKGDEKKLGPKVNDSYFGKVSAERLIVRDDVLFFKGDGKSRGKLGIGPKRTLPFLGAYSEETNVLSIVNFTLPENTTEYVNSMMEIQREPFSGDVVNSYNDGPVEGGSQLGPFFELETSSPAAFLSPGSSQTHVHRTIHLSGDKQKLDLVCKKIFGLSLGEIINAFN
jgi:hypothetical protein